MARSLFGFPPVIMLSLKLTNVDICCTNGASVASMDLVLISKLRGSKLKLLGGMAAAAVAAIEAFPFSMVDGKYLHKPENVRIKRAN